VKTKEELAKEFAKKEWISRYDYQEVAEDAFGFGWDAAMKRVEELQKDENIIKEIEDR